MSSPQITQINLYRLGGPRPDAYSKNAFTPILLAHGIKISMDGKGRCQDNVFVERLWRTVKYEEIDLKAYANLPIAEQNLRAYVEFYNVHRPHSSHDGQTPLEVYRLDRNQTSRLTASERAGRRVAAGAACAA